MHGIVDYIPINVQRASVRGVNLLFFAQIVAFHTQGGISVSNFTDFQEHTVKIVGP